MEIRKLNVTENIQRKPIVCNCKILYNPAVTNLLYTEGRLKNKRGYRIDEVRKFMEALRNDPRAKELINSMDIPADEEKGVAAYLDLGKKLGFSFSREDLLIWVQENEKKCRARAEKAEASMEKALDPEEMSKVAGGKGDKRCESSFNNSEWCWLSDSCKVAVNIYESEERY